LSGETKGGKTMQSTIEEEAGDYHYNTFISHVPSAAGAHSK
jgi:hypothetical protein